MVSIFELQSNSLKYSKKRSKTSNGELSSSWKLFSKKMTRMYRAYVVIFAVWLPSSAASKVNQHFSKRMDFLSKLFLPISLANS